MENERKDIRTLAKKYDKLQTLMCYVNKETLMEQHKKQMKGKASGIDGITKEQYNENVENNIEDLHITTVKQEQVNTQYNIKLARKRRKQRNKQ